MKKIKWNQKKNKKRIAIFVAIVLLMVTVVSQLGDFRKGIQASGTYDNWTELYTVEGLGKADNTITETVTLQGDYKVTQNTTITVSKAGVSGLTIGENTQIYIKEGVTLTVKGGNGNGMTGGGAGIKLPEGKVLKIYGQGTLNVTGGNGGSATAGGAAGTASVYDTVTTGAGGNGGNGAGAPGSGIGGAGGNGGNGGAGGGSQTGTDNSVDGKAGGKGGAGGSGNTMGTLYVYDTVIIHASAGSYTATTILAGAGGGAAKSGSLPDSNYYMVFGSGGGGAGGNAGISANIGGSGGGGGGSAGYLVNEQTYFSEVSSAAAGNSTSTLDKTAGGAGGDSGSGQYMFSTNDKGAGGSGGGVSSGGTGGTVYLSSTAAITDGISGGDTANGEGQAAAVHTLDTLTAEAYYYDDETKTYVKGTDGGTVTAGVHLPGDSCTANADADTEQASVTAETANGYSFAGWYTTSDETGNPLSKDLTYTADFKNIGENTQTVYALFKKASKAAASANGSLNIYKGISETKADGLSAVTIPKNTVITIDGKRKTITQAATYYYTEKITVESGQESSLSSEAGEKLLFVSEPAQNYFYSGVMKDNVYVSHNEFCQYSVMTVGESMPETITALFSAAQTIVLNAEGGTLASYTEPVKMDSANAEFELPQCVRIGYDFKGWVINSSTARTGEYIPFGSVVRYETDETHQMHLVVYTYDEEGNETVAYTAPAEEGITFSAAWDYSTFAINLVNNGATVNQFTGAVYNAETGCYTYTWQEDEDAVLALPTEQDMTYEKYDFLGWYLYEDFSGPSVTEFSTHTTGAKTFYAKWGKEFRASMTISGTAIVGQTLTANAVTSEAGLTLTYQWYRDGKEIPGQKDPTYTLTSEDLGAVISCTATGTGEYTPNYSISCSTEQISNRTGDVLTGLSVTGIAQTGKTLNARVSPANVENVTWQWYRLVPNGEIVEEVLIENADTSSYLLADADTGYAIKCVASDAFGSVYSFTTSKVAAVSDVKLTVTEKTEAACGSGAPIKIDTQNMSAASSITITIPKGLTLTKYPDTEDSTIGNFITSVEKTENEDGTVILVYHFEKKTNVLGFTITVEPDYTNEHGSVKLVETWYSSGEVSLSGNTAVLISNVTAQPGSGYICPVTDSPADYKIESTVYHLYQPAIYLNTQKTLTHPNYKEISMVVPISLENYDNGIQTPVPVLYNLESGEYTELQDGKTYQMTDGEETYTVVYYANYSVKNDAGTEAVYTGPVLVYALPQESALSTGEVSDYRFCGASADGEVLYLRFDEPVAGEYFPKYREQINIKDGNDAKTTVYYAKDRSNYTTLDVIFYEGGTDSLKLTSWIGSLDYSDRNRGNILIPYQYSNRYYAYLSYYSRENLITDMTIDYNLETIGNGTDNSKLGCRRVYICYPDTLKEGTTYQVTLTYADGTTQKYDGPYNKAKWFEEDAENGKDIVNVEVTYHNTAANGGIMRGAKAAMIYCDIYNENNQEPDGDAEADGYINATIKGMTYVKQNEETGEISEETHTKENAASAKSAYHFQTTEEFVPAVPTLDPTSIEVGDTVTVNYTFGNYINPGAAYNPDAYMLMPTGYLYKAGSYQKNAHKDYMASALEKTDLSTIYSTDGILPEAETLLETGKDAGGNVVYQIFGRSVMVNETRYNAYRISYSDNTIRSGYRTLGMDFTVGNYISMAQQQVTLPSALYFDNGEAKYEAEKKTAFISSYKTTDSKYYISEELAGYDINGDGDMNDSFAKPETLPQAALSVSYVMVIDGQTDKDFYKVNERGTYTAVIFNRTSDNTGAADITIDLARSTDAGSEFNMILQGPVVLHGDDIAGQQNNVLYYLPGESGEGQYLTQAQMKENNYSYEDVTQLKISCSELKTGNLNTITFDFISRNIKTGQDEIAAAYVPTTVTYQNSSSDTGTYTTTVPCQIEAARLELTGISVTESESDKGNDVYYVGDTVEAVNPMSELSDEETDTKATFTYQWYRDDKPIEGATAQTYTLQNADYGHTVYCMITGTGDYYSSVKSGVVSKIAVDLENTEPAIDTNITITGNTVLNAQESQRTLTANLDTKKYPSNLQVTYQWYRSQEVEEGTQWVSIEGATSKTYVLTDEDWKHTLCVRAFGEQDSYAYVKTGYSTPTDTITSRNVYVYVKQDGVAADAKGTITLVNTEDDAKTYTLEKQKNTGAYGTSNPEPGTYKVYADDENSGKKVDTGLTLTTGVTTTSAIINYYSINYETLGGVINDRPYPKYYMKNHSETLPVDVTLTSDKGTDTFLGWYLDDHYTSAVQTQVAGTEGKALTYYAKWEYTHPVFYNLTNVTSSNTDTTVWGGTTYETTLRPPSEYYEINKDTIEIKVDGVVLSKDEYSYTEGTGLLEIGGAKTTGVIDITAQSKAKTYLISRDLEHITSNKNTVAQIEYGTNYTETLTTDAGYMTPSEITVMRGNKVLDPSLYTVTMSGRTIKVTIPGKEITDEIEIIAKAVSNEAATHTLTINYVDADGNKAADSVIQQISEGDSYSFSSPEVSGYTPDLSVVAGTMDTTDVTVNVIYRQNDGSTGLPEDAENDGQTDSSDTWVNTGAANLKGDIVYKDATSNITITVKHQDEGKTVEGITTYAYQILSITGGNKEDGYQYAVNKYYQEYFNELLGIAEDQNATAAQVVTYLNEHLTTNDEKNKFLDDIYAYTMINNVPDVDNETGVLNSTQFTLDCSRRYTETDGYYAGMGYYFFASQGTTGNQMTLTRVTRDMTVYIKSQQMKLEKEVAERDYHMGHQTIEYTLYAYIPNLANVGTGYKYIIHDTASKGLTLDVNSIVIIVSEDGTEGGAVTLVKDGDYKVRQYTKDNNNDSLEITFDFDNGTNLKENQQRGKVVKVTYTALINEDAVVGNAANPNTAYLTYSNDPYHDMGSTDNTIEDKEVVYTYGIDIFKTGGTLPDSAPLPGAEFQIQELKPEGAETLSFQPNGEGGYYKSKDAGAVSTVVTDKNGKFKLYGLAAGTYMFTETKAPANYQPVETFYLKIIAEYDEEGNITSFSGDLSKAKGFVNITGTSKETGIISLKIIDPTEGSSELPATGGRGRVMIYCVGALLLIGAVVLMVIRGRKG